MIKTPFNFLLIILATGMAVCAVQAGPLRQVFEPGLISTGAIEYGLCFSPDGEELFFVRSDGQWGKAGARSSIYHSVKTGGRWSTPKVAAFSGQYNDSDLHISADGKRLFFISDRPAANGESSADIWALSKNDGGVWDDLRRLPEPVNSDRTEFSPRTTANGDLYFASDRAGGLGQGDLYKVSRTEIGYGAVENLGPDINATTGEWNLAINPAGDVLIFEASGRPQNQSVAGDLYVSFQLNGVWSMPQNLVELNTPGSDLSPELVGDQVLYYASNDQAGSFAPKIYQTDARELLMRYRQKAKEAAK